MKSCHLPTSMLWLLRFMDVCVQCRMRANKKRVAVMVARTIDRSTSDMQCAMRAKGKNENLGLGA